MHKLTTTISISNINASSLWKVKVPLQSKNITQMESSVL